MIADLHTHSTFSDGLLPPEDLVERIRRAGLDAMALTDHDTTAGLTATQEACTAVGIRFVGGVEISTTSNDEEVHLLGYAVEASNDDLQSFLLGQEKIRARRADVFLDRLMSAGALPRDTKLEPPPEGGSLGRPHLADALIRAGTVADRQEAFERFLTAGCPTFVPKQFPRTEEAIRLVQAAGGIAVLAHPGHSTAHRILTTLVGEGLDGVEVIHPAHDAMLTEYYTSQAERFGLIRTGGSDYHGPVEGRPDLLGIFKIEIDPGLAEILGLD